MSGSPIGTSVLWAGASQTLAYHAALDEYRRIDPNAKGDDASATVFRIITAGTGA